MATNIVAPIVAPVARAAALSFVNATVAFVAAAGIAVTGKPTSFNSSEAFLLFSANFSLSRCSLIS
jgi:hypothetical protein